MKPFEEQYTAWIDGRLTGAELEEFERALPDRIAAEADRVQARQCADFLRLHHEVPSLTNGDFFSHQLLERIGAEARRERPEPAAPRRRWFTLPGLAWACAFCAVGLLSYYGGQRDRFHSVAVTTTPLLESSAGEPHSASIIKASTEDPDISATSVQEGDMAVLWLDGLDYLPASYKLQ